MNKNMEFSYLLDFYGGALTEKQRNVMEQYYNEDLSLAEIAEQLSISRQGVRDSIKHGEATLLQLEEAVGAVARHRALAGQIEEMELLAKRLKYGSEEGNLTDQQLRRISERMLTLLEDISRREELSDGI